jgi:hypothetical protein
MLKMRQPDPLENHQPSIERHERQRDRLRLVQGVLEAAHPPGGRGGRSGAVSSKAHKVDPHIRSLVIAILDARYVSRYSDGRPDEPFGEEVWQDICKDTSPSGARFDVGTPEQVVSEALAVRDAFIDQIAQGEGSVSKAWLRKQKSKR